MRGWEEAPVGGQVQMEVNVGTTTSLLWSVTRNKFIMMRIETRVWITPDFHLLVRKHQEQEEEEGESYHLCLFPPLLAEDTPSLGHQVPNVGKWDGYK